MKKSTDTGLFCWVIPKAKKKRKTIKFATLKRLSFCNSKKLPKRIVHDGVVKEWVGIGWIELKDEKPKPSDVYVVGG